MAWKVPCGRACCLQRPQRWPTSPALAGLPSMPPTHPGPRGHPGIFISLLLCFFVTFKAQLGCGVKVLRIVAVVCGGQPLMSRGRWWRALRPVRGPEVACAPFRHESVMKTHGPRCPGWSPGAGITGFSIRGAVSRWVLFPPQDSSRSLENATGALLVPWAGAWGSPARLGRTSPGLSTWRGRPVPGAGLGGRAGRRSSGCLDISSWLLACSSTPWGHSHLPSDC